MSDALLIEDNLMFAATLEPGLRQLGYTVCTASNAAAALGCLETPPPELVLINLAAIRFSGAGLVRAFRARDEWKDTPILGYAGHVERELFAAGEAAGVTLVVPNSAIRGSLPAVLEKLARRVSGAANDGKEEGTDRGTPGPTAADSP